MLGGFSRHISSFVSTFMEYIEIVVRQIGSFLVFAISKLP